jgi:hypothetical protein
MSDDRLTRHTTLSLLHSFLSIRKSIHFFTQTGCPVVLVSISSGVDVACHFLSATTNASILGVVAVDPPHHDLAAAIFSVSSSSSVPVLVTLSWNEEQLVDKDRQLYLANPSIILVQHNNKDIYGIDWERSILDGGDSSLSSSSTVSVSLQETYWLWLVRTIAKFSEAVVSLDHSKGYQKNVNTTKTFNDTVRQPPPRLHNKLSSKL